MDFVVGHPRSGTMFVSHLLNAAAPVSEHELLCRFGWRGVTLPTEFYLGRAGADSVARLLERYARRPEGVRVDCNWKLTWILPPLLERFPDARVVHLTRDPRENVRSTFELDYYGGPPPADDPQRNHWLKWIPPVRRADWSRLTRLERNCAFWSESHRLALAALDGRARTLRLRLEDLVADHDGDAAARLFAFLEVPPPAPDALARLQRTRVNTKEHEKRARLPAWPGWPAADRQALVTQCGALARQLGYELRSSVSSA